MGGGLFDQGFVGVGEAVYVGFYGVDVGGDGEAKVGCVEVEVGEAGDGASGGGEDFHVADWAGAGVDVDTAGSVSVTVMPFSEPVLLNIAVVIGVFLPIRLLGGELKGLEVAWRFDHDIADFVKASCASAG